MFSNSEEAGRLSLLHSKSAFSHPSFDLGHQQQIFKHKTSVDYSNRNPNTLFRPIPLQMSKHTHSVSSPALTYIGNLNAMKVQQPLLWPWSIETTYTAEDLRIINMKINIWVKKVKHLHAAYK